MSNTSDSKRQKEHLQYFKDRHEEIYRAYETYGRLIHEEGGPLEEKSRWLIKVALTTAGQNTLALNTHLRKALKSGCTAEEIEHAILLVAPSAGFPKMMEGLLVLREVLADASKASKIEEEAQSPKE